MKYSKRIFILLFFVILSGELIQHHLHPINVETLHGSSTQLSKPIFSFDKWLEGTFQEEWTKYLDQKLDLHSFLVRLSNQIDYTLFKQTKAVRVEEGKDGYLFDNGYIESYYGDDYEGDYFFLDKAKKLLFIQEKLKEKNIELIFIIPAGKPSLYLDKIPKHYFTKSKKKSNYEGCVEQFRKHNIQLVDLRNYLLKVKDTAKYPLFSKKGVHWSGYTATITADTVIRYMENLKKIDLPDYRQTGGETTFTPRGTDDDILKAMNLLIEDRSEKLFYPTITFDKPDSTKVKPNVLIIGDSFVWTWLNFYEYIPHLFSEKSEYWYYNKEVHWPLQQNQFPYSVSTKNLAEKVKDRDYILLVFNDASLIHCGYGAIEQLYDILK